MLLLIKHRRYRDVCISVYLRRFGNRSVGRGMFMNMGDTDAWPMQIRTRVNLTDEELKDWQWYPRIEKNLRDKPWRDFRTS